MKSPKTRAPETGTLIGVRLQANALAHVDEWRRGQPDLPTRPEAIRRMIEAYRDGSPAPEGLGPIIRAFIAKSCSEIAETFARDYEPEVASIEIAQWNEAAKRALALSDYQLQQEFEWFVERLIQKESPRRRRSSKAASDKA